MPGPIYVGQYVTGASPAAMAVPIPAPDATNYGPTPGLFPNDGAYGQLGGNFNAQGKRWMFVVLDPAWLSSNAAGAIVAGQVAFWQNKAKYQVTNDITACIASAAPAVAVAGIFMGALSTNGAGGTYMCILIAGGGITVAAKSTVASGNPLMADSTAATAQTVLATGVNPVIGIARSAYSAGFCTADIMIAGLP